MNEKLKHSSENVPTWREVMCWFGAANWPDSTTYRGDLESGKVQVLHVRPDGSKLWVGIEGDEARAVFLNDLDWAKPEDREFLMACYNRQ